MTGAKGRVDVAAAPGLAASQSITASLLAGCATGRSDGAPCPPVSPLAGSFWRGRRLAALSWSRCTSIASAAGLDTLGGAAGLPHAEENGGDGTRCFTFRAEPLLPAIPSRATAEGRGLRGSLSQMAALSGRFTSAMNPPARRGDNRLGSDQQSPHDNHKSALTNTPSCRSID